MVMCISEHSYPSDQGWSAIEDELGLRPCAERPVDHRRAFDERVRRHPRRLHGDGSLDLAGAACPV
jgi:hypothetical protein